jgi:oligo-1,6-glucosidase
MIKNNGGDLTEFIKAQKISARDNGRTPFQWNADKNAGFTVGKPWIKINENNKTVNVAVEEKDPNSCLNYFRKMVQLRKSNKTLVYGKYTLIDKSNPEIYSYTRGESNNKLLILLNFSKDKVAWKITDNLKLSDKVLINNYPQLKKENNCVILNAFQAVCLQLD